MTIPPESPVERDVSGFEGVVRQTDVVGRDGRAWIVSTSHIPTRIRVSEFGVFTRLSHALTEPGEERPYETEVFLAGAAQREWWHGHSATEGDARALHQSVVDRIADGEIMLVENYVLSQSEAMVEDDPPGP